MIRYRGLSPHQAAEITGFPAQDFLGWNLDLILRCTGDCARGVYDTSCPDAQEELGKDQPDRLGPFSDVWCWFDPEEDFGADGYDGSPAIRELIVKLWWAAMRVCYRNNPPEE